MTKYPWLKHYPENVPPAINYPQITLGSFLTNTVARHPDYIAYSFNDIDTSYLELNEKVNKFAFILQKGGIKKGGRVALISVNSPTHVIAFFTIMKLGAVAVNISVGIQGEELSKCMNSSGAKAVVTLDLFAQNLYNVIKDTDIKMVFLHSVFGLEKKISLEEGMPAPQVFLEVIASVESGPEPSAEISAGDVAVLQYTSGSTGAPKAATLTNHNIVASVFQSDTWMGVRGAGNAAVMCVIPFFHVFGMTACLLVAVLKGYRMILLPLIDLMDILSLIKMLEKYKPISFPAVPSLWSAIMSMPPEDARAKFSSIKVAVSGGAPMGSIGLPLPDNQARIMDMETGQKECAVGEVGELVVKGTQIMQGYWNNNELTAAVLRDGWFYTGDMARMDENGFFYLVDRKDDLIISKGFNIYPGQVEEVLKQHPKVKDAAVIGIPDRTKGQAVLAAVALKDGMEADKEEFLQYCREKMPEYRVPKTILIRDEIPRDPAGKLLRRILRKDAQGN